MLQNALIIFLATGVYGFLHSAAASRRVKEWVKTRWGRAAARGYRLAYNVIFTVLLLPLLKIIALLPDQMLYILHPPLVYVSAAGQAAGLLLALDATLRTDLWSFLGLRPERTGNNLVISGAYRWVRHPMYAGSLLIIWLMPAMTLNSALFYAALTIYIVVGAHLEERKLIAQFGDAYLRYRRQVPMLIPKPPRVEPID